MRGGVLSQNRFTPFQIAFGVTLDRRLVDITWHVTSPNPLDNIARKVLNDTLGVSILKEKPLLDSSELPCNIGTSASTSSGHMGRFKILYMEKKIDNQ